MKLEVGKTYINGKGERITIKRIITNENPYKFEGDDKQFYTEEDWFHEIIRTQHLDLKEIERVTIDI